MSNHMQMLRWTTTRTMFLLALALMIFLAGCRDNNLKPDAHGSFEATTMTISPEVGGKITSLTIQEGQTYPKGKTVGSTDTTQLHLKKERLRAKKRSARSQLEQIEAQLAVFETQMQQLDQEVERFQGLVATGGAKQKQVDDLKNERQVIERKKAAIASKISKINAEVETITKQIAQVDDQIDNCRITMPVKGTVLDQLKEEGEFARTGTPLFRLGKLDHLEFKGFITGTQLSEVELGQKVTVRIGDSEEAYKRFPGKITWIAEEAEFSPKNIKTKQERANLVYAMKVRVKNEGQLKIGMPGEVVFEQQKEQ